MYIYRWRAFWRGPAPSVQSVSKLHFRRTRVFTQGISFSSRCFLFFPWNSCRRNLEPDWSSLLPKSVASKPHPKKKRNTVLAKQIETVDIQSLLLCIPMILFLRSLRYGFFICKWRNAEVDVSRSRPNYFASINYFYFLSQAKSLIR